MPNPEADPAIERMKHSPEEASLRQGDPGP